MTIIGSGFYLDNLVEAVIRLIFACVIGAIIGFEREKKNHPAGLRTHLIVCLGSCLIMVLSIFMAEKTSFDTSRLAQGVISGVGFLGAGTIIRDGNKIRGLTTAASIWTVACLGLVVGAGIYEISLIITIILVFVLIGLGKVETRFFGTIEKSTVVIETTDPNNIIDRLYVAVYKNEGKIIKLDIIDSEDLIKVKAETTMPSVKKHNEMIKELNIERKTIKRIHVKKMI